jgi:hypothetical protein
MIVDKVNWKRFAIDLNTGNDTEYIELAVEVTASQCVKICKETADKIEINPRLKPVANSILEKCSEEIKLQFGIN